MTPDQYCTQRAAPDASALHYALLFGEANTRRAIVALHALRAELERASREPSDLQVAQARLGWWRSELDRIFAGVPGHPVGQALAPWVQAYALPRAPFERMIDGIEAAALHPRPPDSEGLRVQCERIGGQLSILSARVLQGGSAACDDYARLSGVANDLALRVFELGADLRERRVRVPADLLQQCGVSEQQLLALDGSGGFADLIREVARLARAQWRDALAALPPAHRRSQRPGLALIALTAHLLTETERDAHRVLQQRTQLTPLRMHWIAWRTWLSSALPTIGN